jgi:hypothetical protein
MGTAIVLALSLLTVGVVMASGDPPLACNIEAINADQRPRYNALVKQLRAAVQSRNDLPNGYVYAIDTKRIALPEIAEWITMERLCCPFLALQLDVKQDGATRLSMSGPNGTKAVLDQEFPLKSAQL